MIRILGGGLSSDPDPAAPARFSPRALRRVTRLTSLVLPAVEQALAGVEVGESCGLVVGTNLADLAQTTGFLDGLHARGEAYASPQMFQRSVHGAVAGELAILYGLRGYNLTVTQGRRSGAAAYELAELAILSGRCARCLAVSVDASTEVTEQLGQPAGHLAAALLLGT